MEAIAQIYDKMRGYFNLWDYIPVTERISALRSLRNVIAKYEQELFDAMRQDLGKSSAESFMTEVGLVYNDIDIAIKNTEAWAKPRKIKSPLFMLPSKSRVMPSPLGLVLIISPWNYPFALALWPLIAAISAGNCVCLRPSSKSSHTAAITQKIISEAFESKHCVCITGETKIVDELLEYKWDHIFFTGSTEVGRKIAIKAAEQLTPVTLELGGKSPVIVHSDADIKAAAKRIAWGKVINAGQTCVAPDYLYVHASVHDRFIDEYANATAQMYPEPLQSADYPKIISKTHFDRLSGYIAGSKVIYGGETDSAAMKIAPTLIDAPDLSSPVMQDEIFGPILPVYKYDFFEDALKFVKSKPKPLAFYLFTKNYKPAEQIMQLIPFGGGIINDVIIHVAQPYLPFGGVGPSGTGKYHGLYGFDTFSNLKGVLTRAYGIDFACRFPPFTENKLKWLRKLL